MTTEHRGPARVVVTRLDPRGKPVGDLVEVPGVTVVRMTPAADVDAFHQAEAARARAAAKVLGAVRDRLADLGPAVRAAAEVIANALAPLAEGRLGRARPGVEAQRSPYGPRRRW